MDTATGSFKAFTVTGLPGALFGVTRVIATASIEPDGNGYSEYFFLSTRFQPHLFHADSRWNQAEFLESGSKSTFEHYLLMAGEADARDMLLKKLDKLKGTGHLSNNNEDKFKFKECELPTIVEEYRRVHSDKIREIATNTKCMQLKSMLMKG